MIQHSSITVIDQDLLLQASGVVSMRPTDQTAIIVPSTSNEKDIRDFFRTNGAIELEKTYFNDVIAKRTGIKTLSIPNHLFYPIATHPLIVQALDLEELKNLLPIDTAKLATNLSKEDRPR